MTEETLGKKIANLRKRILQRTGEFLFKYIFKIAKRLVGLFVASFNLLFFTLLPLLYITSLFYEATNFDSKFAWAGATAAILLALWFGLALSFDPDSNDKDEYIDENVSTSPADTNEKSVKNSIYEKVSRNDFIKIIITQILNIFSYLRVPLSFSGNVIYRHAVSAIIIVLNMSFVIGIRYTVDVEKIEYSNLIFQITYHVSKYIPNFIWNVIENYINISINFIGSAFLYMMQLWYFVEKYG